MRILVVSDLFPPVGFGGYESETAAARAHGWPAIVLDLHHLALLTDPEAIADALLDG